MGETSFSHGIFAVEIDACLGSSFRSTNSNAGLHAVSHLVLGDPGIDLGVAGFSFLRLIDFGYSIEHGTA